VCVLSLDARVFSRTRITLSSRVRAYAGPQRAYFRITFAAYTFPVSFSVAS